ncbi:DUF6973 domain-containing protein [Parasulfitobacter algicola]|uniref:DUF6973 domain-containing protein n=1 Tax=Parasulfitobacter algicola TaxID=2614809 RepID=UPI001FEAA8C9|nr:hypothetical protein [Sulfitobacter algicola]
MAFDWLESVATGGASDWATALSVASQLPGRIDGPADAYRHLLISAELHRNFNPTYADTLLAGHELDFGLSSNSGMDFHNNEIGRQIGLYVRSQNGSTQDVINIVNTVMSNSLASISASDTIWQSDLEGILWVATGATITTLADGTSIAPIVLAETNPANWQSSNPTVSGTRIPTTDANWPSENWQKGFDFDGVPAALGYLISSEINYLIATGQSPLDALLQILENNPDVYKHGTFWFFVEQHIPRTEAGENQFIGSVYTALAKAGRIDLIPEEHQCFGPEVPIDMWPLDPDLKPGPDGIYDQDEVRAKVWKKPIEQIRMGDLVVSFDDDGNLVPGPVTRTFQNNAKILLNFHGTRVTPGHVYYRPDSKKSYKYETLIDVLRDDGVIEHQDGTLIRAATNVPVDSPRDGFVRAVAGKRKADRTFEQTDEGRIRLGTRFLVGDGEKRKSFAVADLIERNGGVVDEDELVYVGDSPGAPLLWDFSDTLPKPEDFVMACSGTTLEDIYKAAEWESQGPRLPAPMVQDRGPVQPLKGAALSAMPRNEPLNVEHAPMASAKPQRTLNRKQRKAMEAKQRKAAKARKRVAV